MNTMDALRVSMVEGTIAEAQRFFTNAETAFEIMRIRETTDECPLTRAYVFCIACSLEAMGKQLKQKLTDIKGT